MAAIFHILDDSTGQRIGTVILGHLDRAYELGDGPRCPVHDQIAWCWHCGRFVAAEALLTLQEIDDKLRKLRRGEDTQHQRMSQPGRIAEFLGLKLDGRKMTEREINEWSTLRRWREKRRDPPKCLACGSPRIVPVKVGNGSQPHPAGSGTVRFGGASLADVAFMGVYSVDGDKLG